MTAVSRYSNGLQSQPLNIHTHPLDDLSLGDTLRVEVRFLTALPKEITMIVMSYLIYLKTFPWNIKPSFLLIGQENVLLRDESTNALHCFGPGGTPIPSLGLVPKIPTHCSAFARHPSNSLYIFAAKTTLYFSHSMTRLDPVSVPSSFTAITILATASVEKLSFLAVAGIAQDGEQGALAIYNVSQRIHCTLCTTLPFIPHFLALGKKGFLLAAKISSDGVVHLSYLRFSVRSSTTQANFHLTVGKTPSESSPICAFYYHDATSTLYFSSNHLHSLSVNTSSPTSTPISTPISLAPPLYLFSFPHPVTQLAIAGRFYVAYDTTYALTVWSSSSPLVVLSFASSPITFLSSSDTSILIIQKPKDKPHTLAKISLAPVKEEKAPERKSLIPQFRYLSPPSSRPLSFLLPPSRLSFNGKTINTIYHK